MDLGIQGKTAIVCAAGSGLGKACAEALGAEGVNLVITGRRAEVLENAAAELRSRFGVRVDTAPGDITTDEGRRATLTACATPDILVNNTGGPPVGDWRNFTEEQWLAAMDSNMVAAIMLIRAVVDGMAERQFGRIINITSALVKRPHPSLALSVAARIGLTGFAKAIAPNYVAANVTINNLLPEHFGTERTQSIISKLATQNMRTFDEEMAASLASSPARRMGRVGEFGAACAFYCSAHAGYITGQSVLLDGGQYPGVF